jgi:ferric-dicitrate binding protein FerR (iron transport regulator)
MSKSRFIDLMVKSMGKAATEAELAELELFLEKFPEYKRLPQLTDELKSDIPAAGPMAQEELNENLNNIWTKIKAAGDTVEDQPEPKVITGFRWGWAAAAAVLLFAFAGVFYTLNKKAAPQLLSSVLRQVQVPLGATRHLVLADGTKVTLNAGSTFTYPDNFDKGTRDVSLAGEGFFEVTKNPKHPFLVHTNKLTVRVLGTVFNVKAYNNDKTIETTLLKGKVQVQLTNNPEKTIILIPNEKLTVVNQPATKALAANNPKQVKIEYQVAALPDVKPEEVKETAWLDNRILFTNDPFEDVAKQIERKYNVQVVFESADLKNEQISGLLDKESLQTAMQIMAQTTRFKYRFEGSVVYLSRK